MMEVKIIGYQLDLLSSTEASGARLPPDLMFWGGGLDLVLIVYIGWNDGPSKIPKRQTG